eukprot:gene15576-17150_t
MSNKLIGVLKVGEFIEKAECEIPDYFFCFLCHHVMLNAFQLLCGHLVCANCKAGLEGDNLKTCSEEECRKHYAAALKPLHGIGIYDCDPVTSVGQIYEDRYITRKIQTHKIKCKNMSLGCIWEGELVKYKAHVDNCKGTSSSAEKCEIFIKPSNSEKKTSLINNEKHLTMCQYCNQDEIQAGELDAHLKYHCCKARLSCPFTEVGCPEHQGKSQAELLEHKSIGSLIHMDLLLEDYCSLRRICNEEFTNNIKFGRSWKNLENSFKQIENNFLSVSSKVDIRLTETENRLLMLENKIFQNNDNGYDYGKTVKLLESKLRDIEAVLSCFQQDQVLNVRDGSIETRIAKVEIVLEKFTATVRNLEKVNFQKEKELAFKTARVESLEAQMKEYELTSYDGTLLWQITNFTQKRHDAITKQKPYILSPYFYSGKRGYKMCIRLYLNGDGHGKSTHVSIFFTLMKGPFDALLPWPFMLPVGLSIIDQNNSQHCEDSFRPDPSSASFQRPKEDMNISSGCPLFMAQAALERNAYVKDDCMFVKVSVESFSI